MQFFFGHAGHKQSTAGSPSFHFTTPGPVYRCRVDTQRTAARTLRGPQSRDFKYVKRKKKYIEFLRFAPSVHKLYDFMETKIMVEIYFYCLFAVCLPRASRPVHLLLFF